VTRPHLDALRPSPLGRWVVIAAAIVIAGIGWNAYQAWHQGWAAEGDSAIIALRTDDVLSAHPPLLGNPTTAGTSGAQDAFHPGPLEFALLALPLRAWVPEATGLLVGSALINCAAVAVVALFAHRRGGPLFALAAVVWVAVLVWGLGDEIPHDAYNPHIVLLPLALLTVLVWSVATGDRVALPVAVVAASLIAQSHAYEVLVVAGYGALAIIALLARRAAVSWRWLAGCAALGLVLWLPPLIDQLRHRPGNLRRLFDEARGPSEPAEGLRFAIDGLVDTLAPPFRWLERQPSFAELHAHPGVMRTAIAAGALGSLITVTMLTWRRGRQRSAWLAATALVGLATSTFAAARLPQGIASAAPYNHRHWWIAGSLTWFALLWCTADLARARIADAPRRWAPAAATVATLVIVGVAASRVDIGADRGSASFGALGALVDPVARAVDGRGPVVVVGRGAQAFTSIEPGLVSALTLRGIDARVLAGESKIFGQRRVGDAAIRTWVYVLSGPGADAAPSGTTLVARYDPSVDVARGFANAGVSGVAEPIAVYVGSPED
jgi:hypothetical protein